MQHTEHTCTVADGTALHVDVWRSAETPRFVIVMAHGGAEHAGRYAQLAGEMVEHGGLVIAMDHRGLGRSTGTRGHVERFEDYAHDMLAILRERAAALDPALRPETLPWFLFGHSMGGLISLVYLLEHERDLPLKGAIISSPLLGLTMKVPPIKLFAGKLAARIAPKLALPSGIPADAVSRDPEVVARYVADPLRVGVVTAGWFAAMNAAIARVEREAAKIRLPSLWYVGTGDRIVDHTTTQRIFGALPEAKTRDQTLRTFEGYYHELHNEPAELRAPIVAMIRDWIDAHVVTSAAR